jgi:hypothetical protein
MKSYTFRYLQDSTGGWVEVPRVLLDELEIEAHISSVSRVNGEMAYLHEDHDASVLVIALRRRGDVIRTRQTYSDRCEVRDFDRYPENLSLFGTIKRGKLIERKPIQIGLF